MEIECEYRKHILLFKFVKQKPEIKKKKMKSLTKKSPQRSEIKYEG